MYQQDVEGRRTHSHIQSYHTHWIVVSIFAGNIIKISQNIIMSAFTLHVNRFVRKLQNYGKCTHSIVSCKKKKNEIEKKKSKTTTTKFDKSWWNVLFVVSNSFITFLTAFSASHLIWFHLFYVKWQILESDCKCEHNFIISSFYSVLCDCMAPWGGGGLGC